MCLCLLSFIVVTSLLLCFEGSLDYISFLSIVTFFEILAVFTLDDDSIIPYDGLQVGFETWKVCTASSYKYSVAWGVCTNKVGVLLWLIVYAVFGEIFEQVLFHIIRTTNNQTKIKPIQKFPVWLKGWARLPCSLWHVNRSPTKAFHSRQYTW